MLTNEFKDLVILIVDDEADIRGLIADILKDAKYNVRTAANSNEAIEAIRARTPSLIILDIWLQGSELDGLGILELVKKDNQESRRMQSPEVIMISGHGDIQTAVSSIKTGAYDFIEKPFSAERLLIVVKRALETAKLRNENVELRKRGSNESELIGNSAAINAVRQTVEVGHSVLTWAHQLETSGRHTREEAQQMAHQALQTVRYSGNEYFWLQTVDAQVVMHPFRPDLNGKDGSSMKDPDGKPIFAYVGVRADKLEAFMDAQQKGLFYPEEFGVIIESGFGEPGPEVRVKMERDYGFNHDAMLDIPDADNATRIAAELSRKANDKD